MKFYLERRVLINLLTIISILFIGSGCSDLADDRKYAHFQISDERNWTSLEEVLITKASTAIIEINSYAGKKQTSQQKKDADELYEKTFAEMKKNNWFNFEEALKSDFQKSIGSHYLNPTFRSDDRILDPKKPEFLIFFNTSKGMVMAGVMFLIDEHDQNGPQIGGPETVWHFHHFPDTCWLNNLPIAKTKNGKCIDGYKKDYKNDISPQMFHIWFVKHPGGRFGTSMLIPIEELILDPFVQSILINNKFNEENQ